MVAEKSQAKGSAEVTAKNRWYLATIADRKDSPSQAKIICTFNIKRKDSRPVLGRWLVHSKEGLTVVEKLRTGWIDAIRERANLPQMTDLGGALIAYNNLTCSDLSEHTFRRYEIPYMRVGRERRYKGGRRHRVRPRTA